MTRKVQEVLTIAMLMEMMGVFAALAAGKPVDGAELTSGLGTGELALDLSSRSALYGTFTLLCGTRFQNAKTGASCTEGVALFADRRGGASCRPRGASIRTSTLRRAAVITGTTLIGDLLCGHLFHCSLPKTAHHCFAGDGRSQAVLPACFILIWSSIRHREAAFRA